MFFLVLLVAGVNVSAYSDIANNSRFQPRERHISYDASEIGFEFFLRMDGYIGYVDKVSYNGKRLIISGWSYDSESNLPISNVVIVLNDRVLAISSDTLKRPDVSKALGNKRALFSGFNFKINLGDDVGPINICDVKVYAGFFDGSIGLVNNKACD